MAKPLYPGPEPKWVNHPAVNAPHPNVIDDDRTGLGADDASLAQQRAASGGLSDDPTESGSPVKNRKSFRNLTGGR
jgi:hypothetical protein